MARMRTTAHQYNMCMWGCCVGLLGGTGRARATRPPPPVVVVVVVDVVGVVVVVLGGDVVVVVVVVVILAYVQTTWWQTHAGHRQCEVQTPSASFFLRKKHRPKKFLRNVCVIHCVVIFDVSKKQCPGEIRTRDQQI